MRYKVKNIGSISLLIFTMVLITQGSEAQNQALKPKLDQLNTNTSPAFVLLGVAPSEIARPTSIKDFAGSVQSTTNDFMTIPSTYALEVNIKEGKTNNDEIAPYNKILLSIGFISDQTIEIPQTRMGFGFNFCLKNNDTKDEIVEKYEFLKRGYAISRANQFLAVRNQSFKHESIEAQAKSEALIKKQFAQIDVDQTANEEYLIKNTFQAFDIDPNEKVKAVKKGFFSDLHIGASTVVLNNDYNTIQLDRIGSWINFGYDMGIDSTETSISLVGTAKYIMINTPLELEALAEQSHTHNIDVGGRAILLGYNNKLEVSLEGITRARIDLKPDYRIAFNALLDVGNNKRLSLSLGRDYDGVIKRDGNLFSLINFISSI